MFHLLGLIGSAFLALLALNLGIAILQAVFGTATGYDPDKKLRDEEEAIRSKRIDDDDW